MQVERISADITLKHKPRTGTQAYNMLIESLKAEIQEKQEILSHLSQDKIKQKFIENWNPTGKRIQETVCTMFRVAKIRCCDTVGDGKGTTEPSDKISTPPKG